MIIIPSTVTLITAGALPLGVGFYFGVSASALIKRRAASAKSDDPDEHEP